MLIGVQSKIGNLEPLRTKRVRVSGWVHRLRDQKGIKFIILRDGTGYLQAVLSGRVVRGVFERDGRGLTCTQAETYDALTLTLESTVELVGTLQALPEGKTAPGGHELSVDYWKVLGAAPGGEDAFTNRVNEVRASAQDLPVPSHIPRNRTHLSKPICATSSSAARLRRRRSACAPPCSARCARSSRATTCSR